MWVSYIEDAGEFGSVVFQVQKVVHSNALKMRRKLFVTVDVKSDSERITKFGVYLPAGYDEKSSVLLSETAYNVRPLLRHS